MRLAATARSNDPIRTHLDSALDELDYISSIR